MTSLPLYSSGSKKKRAYPEASLQKTVVQHLRLIPLPGVFALSVPNERKCSVAQMQHLLDMGLLPGASDLIIFVWGKPHALELKARDGRLSVAQKAFRQLCLDNGIPYHAAFGIDDALAKLREWRAIKPDAGRRDLEREGDYA